MRVYATRQRFRWQPKKIAEIQPWGHSVVKAFRFLMMFLVVGLTVSASIKPAEANWQSTILKGPNAGYCANARPGAPISHYHAKDPSKCYENRRNGTVQRKTQQGAVKPKKPKSTSVAVGPVLPTAPANKVALSGERVRVGFSYHVNADCRSAGEIKSRMLEHPKNGVAEMVTEKGFPSYDKDNQKYYCNDTKTDVQAYYYKSQEGFKGKDRFVVEVFYPNGNYRERLFNIDIR